jgi:hypothetical protein
MPDRSIASEIRVLMALPLMMVLALFLFFWPTLSKWKERLFAKKETKG